MIAFRLSPEYLSLDIVLLKVRSHFFCQCRLPVTFLVHRINVYLYNVLFVKGALSNQIYQMHLHNFFLLITTSYVLTQCCCMSKKVYAKSISLAPFNVILSGQLLSVNWWNLRQTTHWVDLIATWSVTHMSLQRVSFHPTPFNIVCFTLLRKCISVSYACLAFAGLALQSAPTKDF